MILSCFNPKIGLYDYFETPEPLEFNADLPVPKFPPPAGDIGVPSMDAGRPLPPDARHVGTGWNARGVISSCGRGTKGFNGLGDVTPMSATDWLVIGGVVAVGFAIFRSHRRAA